MDQLPPASEITPMPTATMSAVTEARNANFLYQRCVNKVLAAFCRAGASECQVLRSHLGDRLPEFVAHLQAKGYVVNIQSDIVVVTLPSP